jgi:hypothetical protein
MAEKKGTAELAGGAAALTLAGSSNRIAYRKHTAQRNRIKRAKSYLSQDLPKNDPKKVGLDTSKKKAALREINDAGAKLKSLKTPKVMNRTAFWGTAAAGGGALVYSGGRKKFAKAMTKKEYDRAAVGAVGGAGAYYGAGLASNLYARGPADRKIKDNPTHRATVSRHAKKSFGNGGTLPKTGDPAWKDYNRKFPTNVPGGKLRRVTSVTHAGKTGLALTGAAAAGGALATRKKQIKKSSASAFGVEH